MEWYFKVFRDWKDYKGRATRTEYWMFTLYNFIIMAVIAGLDLLIDTDLIYIIYSLVVLVPSSTVAMRRLHDTGRSAWWFLIMLVPIVGFIVILVFNCQDSREDNKYGKNPKTPKPEHEPVY